MRLSFEQPDIHRRKSTLVPFSEKLRKIFLLGGNYRHHALMFPFALGVFLLGLGAGAFVARLAFHKQQRDLRDDLIISPAQQDDERLRLR